MGYEGDHYIVSESYTNDNGDSVEVNRVVYEREDGGIDYVEQTKVNGREIGHYTEHPDGAVHRYGSYKNDEEDDNNEEDDEEDDDDDDDDED